MDFFFVVDCVSVQAPGDDVFVFGCVLGETESGKKLLYICVFFWNVYVDNQLPTGTHTLQTRARFVCDLIFLETRALNSGDVDNDFLFISGMGLYDSDISLKYKGIGSILIICDAF